MGSLCETLRAGQRYTGRLPVNGMAVTVEVGSVERGRDWQTFYMSRALSDSALLLNLRLADFQGFPEEYRSQMRLLDPTYFRRRK